MSGPIILRDRCGNCKYHFVEDNTCHNRSPQVTIVVLPRLDSQGQVVGMVPQGMSAFPQIAADGWCGEWATRIQLLN